ncbi:MAG TPA: hypothetical protein VGO50_00020, partial [Pyrinomonadaceae bacterium]|nr:hypothetical protein [Pyrinomonadaceae bacterium]
VIDGKRMIAVFGGNQSGKAGIDLLPADSLVGARWPKGEALKLPDSPIEYSLEQYNSDNMNNAVYSKIITPDDVMRQRVARGLTTQAEYNSWSARQNTSA